VSRIRLHVFQIGSAKIPNHSGGIQEIPLFRTFAVISFSNDPSKRWRSILDTGSPHTIFPPGLWEGMEGTDSAPIRLFENHWDSRPTLTIAGCTYEYQWGEVDIVLHDCRTERTLPAVRVIGQFLTRRILTPKEHEHHNGTTTPRRGLNHIVLALSPGVFDGRYLILRPGPTENECDAWVQVDHPDAMPFTKVVL